MFGEIKRDIKMHIKSLKYAWMSFTVYRTQAVIWALVFLLSSITGLVTISVIYSVSNGINGWNYYQVLILAGLSNMMIGIVLYFGLTRIPLTLRNGIFDKMLVKPYNPISMLLLSEPKVVNIMSIISGFGIFAVSAYFLNLGLISILVILLIFFIGVAALIIFMLTMYLLFYVLIKGGKWLNSLIYIGNTASTYPLNIFGTTMMVLFTIGLPIGLATYYPAGFVFGKIPEETILIVIAFEMISIVVYYKLSEWLLTKYTSGGG